MEENQTNRQFIRLLEKHAVTESLFELVFERPEGWDFEPGQFARLGVEIPGEAEPQFRAYSIASSPSENDLRFLVKVITGGLVSPKLAALEPGQGVVLEGRAEGNLLPARIPGGSTMWYFATGAGLAPFLSIMKHNAETKCEEREEILVVGARTVKEVEGLVELARRHSPTCRVFGAATREEHELQGRLPLLLETGRLEEHAGRKISKEDSRVMLCGNPECIKAVRAHFKARGIVSPRFGAPGQLLVESLW